MKIKLIFNKIISCVKKSLKTKTPNELYWRNIRDIEHEIVNLIHMSELAIDFCKSTKIEDGLGPDVRPYLFNLNYCRGVIILHGLLLSNYDDEISVNNYIRQSEWEYKNKVPKEFKKKLKLIQNRFRGLYNPSLRNKIAAHLSYSFSHDEFISAFIIPEKINELKQIIDELRVLFFNYANWDTGQKPFDRILLQMGQISPDPTASKPPQV